MAPLLLKALRWFPLHPEEDQSSDNGLNNPIQPGSMHSLTSPAAVPSRLLCFHHTAFVLLLRPARLTSASRPWHWLFSLFRSLSSGSLHRSRPRLLTAFITSSQRGLPWTCFQKLALGPLHSLSALLFYFSPQHKPPPRLSHIFT